MRIPVMAMAVLSASIPAFDRAIPGSGYDHAKPDCGMSAAQVFDGFEARRIGTLKFRAAKDLPETSSASIGFEGLDRKLFDPTDDVYDRLAACGVKRARVQTMWSRCETRKGEYDFSVLDDVIGNLLRRGIRPWFSVTFGNTLYMTGCRTQAAVGNVPLYYGDECRVAWLSFVRALARRYRGKVAEWEIWNEPNGADFWQPCGPDPKDYIELVKITGGVVREEIPDAKIGGTTASPGLRRWDREFFRQGGARYIDFWCFHAYGTHPETCRISPRCDFVEAQLQARQLIDKCGGRHVAVWQGESGFPSWFHKNHWLFAKGICQEGWQSQANQAKWLLRRFVTDRRSGIAVSSFYQACDIVRRYSMATITRSHPAEHGVLNGWTHEPKMSYRALGNYSALLADAKYDATVNVRVWPEEDADVKTIAACFRLSDGRAACAYYAPFDFCGSYTGKVYAARTDARLTLPKTMAPKHPVLVDLLRGGVYDVKAGTVRGEVVEYADLPLVDYPVVLTDWNDKEINSDGYKLVRGVSCTPLRGILGVGDLFLLGIGRGMTDILTGNSGDGPL